MRKTPLSDSTCRSELCSGKGGQGAGAIGWYPRPDDTWEPFANIRLRKTQDLVAKSSDAGRQATCGSKRGVTMFYILLVWKGSGGVRPLVGCDAWAPALGARACCTNGCAQLGRVALRDLGGRGPCSPEPGSVRWAAVMNEEPSSCSKMDKEPK